MRYLNFPLPSLEQEKIVKSTTSGTVHQPTCMKMGTLNSKHMGRRGLGHFGRGHLGRGHYGRGHLGRGHYGRGHLGRGHLGRGHFGPLI